MVGIHRQRTATKIIGGAIREARLQRRVTLEGLAKTAGISYQYLSGIETGKENFSIHILEKITLALEMPLVALISAAYRPERLSALMPSEVDAAA